MGTIISNNSYDLSNLTIVPTIASYDSFGNFAPLYVRLNGEPYKILSYYRIDNLGFPEFCCKINHYGRTRDIRLVYHPREFVWSLKN